MAFYSTIFSKLTTLIPVDSVVDQTKNVKIKNVVEIKEKSIPVDQANKERREDIHKNITLKKLRISYLTNDTSRTVLKIKYFKLNFYSLNI